MSQHFLAALGLFFPFKIPRQGPSVIPNLWDMGILEGPKPGHTPFPRPIPCIRVNPSMGTTCTLHPGFTVIQLEIHLLEASTSLRKASLADKWGGIFWGTSDLLDA